MDVRGQLSKAAALIGDSSRAAMLWSLMGGESRPASELAMLANISPQSASNHLKLLLDGGFLRVAVLGRNKFYRLGGPTVALALESLAGMALGKPAPSGLAQHSAPQLVFARTCYDHLAGELAVAILGRLRDQEFLHERKADFSLSPAGDKFLRDLGIDIARLRTKRRRFAYACLDWSHRVPHLGGALGAALLDWLFRSKAVARQRATRALRLTDTGHLLIKRHFAIGLTRDRTAIVPIQTTS